MNNQIDLNTIMYYMVVIMMMGMMMRVMTKTLKPAAERPLIYGPKGEVLTHHSSIRRLGTPRTESERAKVHEEFYGTRELPPRGTGLGERGESAEGRGLGEPKTTAERKETHRGIYGTSKLPERGKGRPTVVCPICGEEVEVRGSATRSEALRKHLEEKHSYGIEEEHHSIHGPERVRLVDEYGSWAVGRAEAICPKDDVECVEREASRLLGAYRRSFTEY